MSPRYPLVVFALMLALCAGSLAAEAPAAEAPYLTADLDVVNSHSEVVAGENLVIITNLVSRGFSGRFDVMLVYTIKTQEGGLVLSESETIAVEIRNSHSKSLSIGEDMEGPYTVEVAATPLLAQGEPARASRTFRVVKMSREELDIFTILLIVAVGMSALGIIYDHHRTTVLFKLSEESLKGRATK